MSNAEAVRLTEEYAPLLAQLETSYPPGMRQGESAIREKLKELDDSGYSLSWMLHVDDECLGYLVAWPGESLLDLPNGHRVIFIDDLQVRPGHGTQLYALLKLLAEDIVEKDLCSLSIEAVCRRNAYKVFKEHEGAIARLGYELLATYEYWEETVGEELCWMRWKPLQEVEEDAAADAWIPAAAESDAISDVDSVVEEGTDRGSPLTVTWMEDGEAVEGELDIPASEEEAADDWTPATQAQMLKVRAQQKD